MPKLSDNSTGTFERLSVLVVDDLLAQRVLFKAIAASKLPGSTVHVADSGLAAIETARHYRPDVILLDLHLPDMDGIEVLRILNDDPDTAGIPVIILSGDDTPSSIALVTELGAVDYITKPYAMDDIALRIVRAAHRDHG
jgi:CheY-like chemotaxis protein